MNDFIYKIGKNDAINRWLVTDVIKEPYKSPYSVFDADINLGEGYVQIIYPVREEFLKENKIKEINYYNEEIDNVYFPFENNRVEFTDFIHTPHHIYFYAKCFIIADEDCSIPFELYTCGGVKIWVNKQEAITFAPYTRNIPSLCRINIDLKKGKNEILIYADELAERDVFFYYELRYIGEKSINVSIPMIQQPTKIREAEDFLKSCYFTRDCFTEGIVSVGYCKDMVKDEYLVNIESDAISKNSVMMQSQDIIDKGIKISKSKSYFEVTTVEKLNIGLYKFNLIIDIDGIKISRGIVTGIYPNTVLNITPKSTVQERKRQALEVLSKHGENVLNKAIASIESDKKLTDDALKALNNGLELIRSKGDCSDFYMVPLILIYQRYNNYLSEELEKEIKKIIIEFRYWIDEPGNDVMWYFSENHALLFHTSQYLAGYLFQDDTFTVSGKTGINQYQIGKKRLEEWFEVFNKYGYAEWNSATYLPIDLIGFFVLYELAPDNNIKNLAQKALDFTFKVIDYNTFNGIMGTSHGRIYEHTLKARQLNEVSFISWITYGEGYVNISARAVTLYCISDYIPNNYKKDLEVNSNEAVVIECLQGKNEVETYLYRDNYYQMASVLNLNPFKHGHQQHTSNVALGKKSVQFYINHPGEKPFSGEGRPSYWAGNGTNSYIEQYKNVTMVLINIEENELVKYVHAYFPVYEYDEYKLEDKWLFCKVDDSYMGVYFANGFELIKQGANTNKEIISYGSRNGVIVKCSSIVESASFNNFIEQCCKSTILYEEIKSITFNDSQYGHMQLKYPEGLMINNQKVVRDSANTFLLKKVLKEL